MIRHSGFLVITCFLLVATACNKKQAQAKKDQRAHLELAQHFDIPVPLTFKLADTLTKQDPKLGFKDFMQYKGALSVSKTIEFFKTEMERAGWDIIDLSTNHEGFLFCSKPTKQCGIQIRPTGNPQKNSATTLCLFITQGRA